MVSLGKLSLDFCSLKCDFFPRVVHVQYISRCLFNAVNDVDKGRKGKTFRKSVHKLSSPLVLCVEPRSMSILGRLICYNFRSCVYMCIYVYMCVHVYLCAHMGVHVCAEDGLRYWSYLRQSFFDACHCPA